MSTEKKVLFLLLALITLIITCVFNHVDDFKVDENTTNTPVETNSPSIVSTITEKVKLFISPVEEEITQEKVIQDEKSILEKTEESITPDNNMENESLENKTLEDNNVSEESMTDSKIQDEINTEVIVEEEKIEEPVVPIIITDKRYNRIGDEKNIEDLSNEAQLLQIKMNDFVKENPIIFKRGSNKITNSSNKTIKSVVEALKEFPTMKIEVAGHTDAIGAKELNKAISEQRAISVKDRLVYYGIESDRIKARGYGEDIPLVKNSKNGYSKINRRVEFNIVEE